MREKLGPSEIFFRDIEDQVNRCNSVDDILRTLNLMAGVYKNNVELWLRLEGLGKGRLIQLNMNGKLKDKDYRDALDKFTRSLSEKMS